MISRQCWIGVGFTEVYACAFYRGGTISTSKIIYLWYWKTVQRFVPFRFRRRRWWRLRRPQWRRKGTTALKLYLTIVFQFEVTTTSMTTTKKEKVQLVAKFLHTRYERFFGRCYDDLPTMLPRSRLYRGGCFCILPRWDDIHIKSYLHLVLKNLATIWFIFFLSWSDDDFDDHDEEIKGTNRCKVFKYENANVFRTTT